MKKVFSAALCLLMLVQLLPVHVHAETATDNVAKVTMGGAETYYEKLTDAVKAVKDAAAADNAVVQLLQTVDLGTGMLILESGVFTLDLNGKTVVSARDTMEPYVLYSYGSDVELKIIESTGTGEGKIESVAGSAVCFMSGKLTIDSGKIAGKTYGVYLTYEEASAVINGGTITGDDTGICLNAGSLEITDGTIYGNRYGVCNKGGTLTVTGGKIDASDAVVYESDTYFYPAGVYAGSAAENTAIGGNVSIGGCCGVRVSSNNTTISGGTISGEEYDLLDWGFALTVDENGNGASFPGGLKTGMRDGGNSANGISVTEFLDAGAAYWQNGEQLYGLGIRWEIEGDVAVKAVCEHENAAYSAGSTTVYADDPLGHDWYDATYNFAVDGSACTAKHVCKRDGSHVESATAVITSAVSKQPTTEAMGDTAYTATFAVDWAEDTTLVLTDIPKLNSVKVEPMRDGGLSLSNETPATGEEVTITVSPNIGMEVDRVIVRDSEGNEIWSTDSDEGIYTYTQPEGDVTIVVNFKVGVYEVKNEAPEGVTVMADNLTPILYDSVTITVENNSGKQIDKVTVIDRVGNEAPLTDNGNGTYTFAQPEGDVTVKVTLKSSTTPPINTGTWEEPEAPAESTDDSWHVLCRKLNVRAGAGTQYKRVGSLSRGETVRIVESRGGWHKIVFEDGYAWVCAKYIG